MKKWLCGLLLLALCVSLCACAVTTGSTYPNAKKYTVGNLTYDAAAVDTVEINWQSGRVELTESDGAALNAREKTDGLTNDQLMRWWLDGRTLRIQFWKSGYTGTLKNREKRLTVEIPKDIALTVNVTSGEVVMRNHQLGDVSLAATSGDIELGAVNADAFTAQFTSGSIQAGPLRVKKQIKMACTSGGIKIDNAMADDVNLEITSGKITAGPIDAATFTASQTSGKIKLEAVKAETAKLNATSGDMELGVYQCGSVKISCTSGDVKLSAVHGSGLTVDFNTLSGSLNGKSSQKTWHETVGDGASKVTVNTTSGDLKIVSE